MKRASILWTLRFGWWTIVLFLCLPPAFPLAFAFTADKDNPYATIVERNAFALKPPAPPAVVTPPAPPASNVELRGITTLLGRPQVLLNFKMPAKPPEPPKDRSLVMDVGQREGEVEVLEINPAAGSIRIRNQGNELAMNLKDNAPKAQAAPNLAPPAMVPGVPPQPVPGGIPAPANPSATPPSLPTRTLRSETAPASTPNAMIAGEGANQAAIMNRSPEANAALYSVSQAKNEELRASGVQVPRLPKHPLLNATK